MSEGDNGNTLNLFASCHHCEFYWGYTVDRRLIKGPLMFISGPAIWPCPLWAVDIFSPHGLTDDKLKETFKLRKIMYWLAINICPSFDIFLFGHMWIDIKNNNIICYEFNWFRKVGRIYDTNKFVTSAMCIFVFAGTVTCMNLLTLYTWKGMWRARFLLQPWTC